MRENEYTTRQKKKKKMSSTATPLDGTSCPKTFTYDKKTRRCKKAARFSAPCPEGTKRDDTTGYCRKTTAAKTQRRRPRAGPTRSLAELAQITDYLHEHVAQLLKSSSSTVQTLQSFNGDLADHDYRIARLDQQVRELMMMARAVAAPPPKQDAAETPKVSPSPVAAASARMETLSPGASSSTSLPPSPSSPSPKTGDLQDLLSMSPMSGSGKFTTASSMLQDDDLAMDTSHTP